MWARRDGGTNTKVDPIMENLMCRREEEQTPTVRKETCHAWKRVRQTPKSAPRGKPCVLPRRGAVTNKEVSSSEKNTMCGPEEGLAPTPRSIPVSKHCVLPERGTGTDSEDSPSEENIVCHPEDKKTSTLLLAPVWKTSCVTQKWDRPQH